MSLFKLLSVWSPAYTWFVTLFKGKYVGMDQSGNKYYKARPRAGYKRERRWVVYKGEAEATKVPPEWHGWLHHQMNTVPESGKSTYRKGWQKPHKPNRTGTDEAYMPPGHMLKGGQRDKATGDYEAWAPPEK